LLKGEKSAFGLMVGQQSYFLDGQICPMELWWRNCSIENFISENGKYRVLIAPDKMKINGQNN
jgi:hypothetical protein